MRSLRQRDEMIWQAWHTAWLHRVDAKKFPKLSDLLKAGEPKAAGKRRQRTWQEIAADMQTMTMKGQG